MNFLVTHYLSAMSLYEFKNNRETYMPVQYDDCVLYLHPAALSI